MTWVLALSLLLNTGLFVGFVWVLADERAARDGAEVGVAVGAKGGAKVDPSVDETPAAPTLDLAVLAETIAKCITESVTASNIAVAAAVGDAAAKTLTAAYPQPEPATGDTDALLRAMMQEQQAATDRADLTDPLDADLPPAGAFGVPGLMTRREQELAAMAEAADAAHGVLMAANGASA